MPEFVSLEDFLRAGVPAGTELPNAESPQQPPPVEEPQCEGDDALEAALAAARRFRAALDEALERAVATIAGDVAAEVVARELAVAPVDLRGIVERARLRYGIDDVIRVRVHPDETSALAEFEANVVADPHLRRGDVEIDVRDGTIDATLGARLAAVLAR